MADPKGFLKTGREVATRRPVDERVKGVQRVLDGGRREADAAEVAVRGFKL